jgi:hypothetical protein
MKVNKRDHPVSATYNCTDCVFVFTIHSNCEEPLCPNCGDSISVVPFVKDDGTKKKPKPWTDEEFALIDRIIAGELLKYQVAATLGRSYGAVQRKVEHRRKKHDIIKT